MTKEMGISHQQIENRIFKIRGEQVMLDRDLAESMLLQIPMLLPNKE